MRDLAYRALQAREEIQREKQRDATLEEIAEKIGEKKENVGRAMEAIVEPISIYESVYGEGEDSMFVIDQLGDENESDERWVENISLKEAMKKLNERESGIIKLRYFRGKTQMEIAAEIGISQAQVSRLEKAAIEKLRKYME
jgi:RNA polymerase sporulation-specific sigma factor